MTRQLKQGDKVKRIYSSNCGVEVGEIGEVNRVDGTWVVVNFNGRIDYHDIKNLELLPKTIDDIDKGDTLVDEFGDEIKVLGKCGLVYFLSEDNDFDSYDCGCTLDQIKNWGYKLKEDEEVLELTVKDVEEKFGKKVKIVKG